MGGTMHDQVPGADPCRRSFADNRARDACSRDPKRFEQTRACRSGSQDKYRSGRLPHLSQRILAPSWSSVMALSIGIRSRSILSGTHTCPCSIRNRSRDNLRPRAGRWCGSLPSAHQSAIEGTNKSRSSTAFSTGLWHSLCKPNSAGGFEISVPKPAPPSDYIPRSGVARCVPCDPGIQRLNEPRRGESSNASALTPGRLGGKSVTTRSYINNSASRPMFRGLAGRLFPLRLQPRFAFVQDSFSRTNC
jgi:hypothetical protein